MRFIECLTLGSFRGFENWVHLDFSVSCGLFSEFGMVPDVTF